MTAVSLIDEVLTGWFGAPTGPDYGRSREMWWSKDPRVDAELRARWSAVIERAELGELQGWTSSPRGSLALVVLTDQIARNVFRATPRMYATDPIALEVASQAIARGFDAVLLAVERWMLYMPFMHAESRAIQRRSLELFRDLRAFPETAGTYEHAVAHHDIVARFGRFPHRNAIMRRPSTEEELAFLARPGSAF